MPLLSAWFVRTALLYLALGFTLGGVLLWNKGVPIHPAIWQLLPAHMEFLLMGWTVQLVIGIAYWILPRFHTKRGKRSLVWLSFLLLNAGIWLVVVDHLLGNTYVAGRLLELGAVAAFAIHAWVRVKPVETLRRAP